MPASLSVRLQNLLSPLIDLETAVGIGELVLNARWKSCANQYLPLLAEDKKDYWRVLGSSEAPNGGQYCILISKSDGLITEVGVFHGGNIPD